MKSLCLGLVVAVGCLLPLGAVAAPLAAGAAAHAVRVHAAPVRSTAHDLAGDQADFSQGYADGWADTEDNNGQSTQWRPGTSGAYISGYNAGYAAGVPNAGNDQCSVSIGCDPTTSPAYPGYVSPPSPGPGPGSAGAYDSALYAGLPVAADGFVHGLVGDYGWVFIAIGLGLCALYVVRQWSKGAFH